MPRARSRSSAPIVPGRSERSSASPSAASAPIVSTPALPQPLLCARADAREEADGERSEEARLGPGRDDGDAAGLAAIGRDLADDLRRADAERARQARLRAHRGLDRRRDCARAREVGCDRAEIEVALVDPRALDARDDLADRVPHDARVLPIERMPRPEEDGGRAAPQRLGGAHRRVDAELPRGVVRGRDDAAAVRVSADDERLVTQLRVLELLDGREERVEVEVREDLHRQAKLLLPRDRDASASAAGDRAAGAAPGVVRARHGTRRTRDGAGDRPCEREAPRVAAARGPPLHAQGDASSRRRDRSRHDDRAQRAAIVCARPRRLRPPAGIAPSRRRAPAGSRARAKADRVVRDYPGTAGYYVQSLTGGSGAAWNAKARFPAASTVKLAIAATVLAEHPGIPPPGSRIDGLLREMIIPSDDAAANSLLVWLAGSTSSGAYRVNDLMRGIGLTDTLMYGGYATRTLSSRHPASRRRGAGLRGGQVHDRAGHDLALAGALARLGRHRAAALVAARPDSRRCPVSPLAHRPRTRSAEARRDDPARPQGRRASTRRAGSPRHATTRGSSSGRAASSSQAS